MKRFFHIVLGALAMLIIALCSAFLTMRLAIHGRVVRVPDLTGVSLTDAQKKASAAGLNLHLEDRFYSPTSPTGQVLAQSPAPGTEVRRQWTVRVTASLGPQEVAVPDLLNQSERTATINIRRLGLEAGTVAQIPYPGDPGMVVAQTPNPNATGVDSPRVSLLLAATDEGPPSSAIVMPSLAGLTLSGASARVAAAGLHLVSAEDLNVASVPSAPASPGSSAEPVARPVVAEGTVIAQSPPAGHRVLKGEAVHITLTN